MLWTHIYYHISGGIFKKWLQEEVTEFVGNCSFRTCCELICGKRLFFIAGRPYSFKVCCLIWVLNLLTFCYSWSALFLENLLLDLGAKFANLFWKSFVFYSWSALFLERFCLIWVLNLLTVCSNPLFFIAGRPYSLKGFCLIWVLNFLTFCGNPLFFIAGRPYSLKVSCLIWLLNCLRFVVSLCCL